MVVGESERIDPHLIQVTMHFFLKIQGRFLISFKSSMSKVYMLYISRPVILAEERLSGYRSERFITDNLGSFFVM